jgi:hypothetical protein
MTGRFRGRPAPARYPPRATVEPLKYFTAYVTIYHTGGDLPQTRPLGGSRPFLDFFKRLPPLGYVGFGEARELARYLIVCAEAIEQEYQDPAWSPPHPAEKPDGLGEIFTADEFDQSIKQ